MPCPCIFVRALSWEMSSYIRMLFQGCNRGTVATPKLICVPLDRSYSTQAESIAQALFPRRWAFPSVVNRTALLFAEISSVKEGLRRKPFHFLSWEKLRFPVFIVHDMLMSLPCSSYCQGRDLSSPPTPRAARSNFPAIKSLVDLECSDGRV